MSDRAPTVDLQRIGTTGINPFGQGLIYDEFLPELSGPRWHRAVREMAEQDPTVGAILFAVEMLVRRVDWSVAPASEDPADVEAADFVTGCLFHDIEPGWEDTLAEILSFLSYGWSLFETVYKRRTGEGGETPSNYNDGKIGWAGWGIRPQESLARWVFDGDRVAGFRQWTPSGLEVEIPAEKFLLFRSSSRRGSPEGRSVLRNAYLSWYLKKNIQRIEGIGIERDLAGLPVAWVPPELMQATATVGQQAVMAAIKKIVTGIRRDANEGVVMPLEYDANGKPRYDLKLLSTGGSRQFDTNEIVQRYDVRIAMSVLADFVFLGHQRSGSYALSEDKTRLFTTALETWLDTIAGTINDRAIKPLLAINGYQTQTPPTLTHGNMESVNLGELGTYLSQLAAAGILTLPNPELEAKALELAGMPAAVAQGDQGG